MSPATSISHAENSLSAPLTNLKSSDKATQTAAAIEVRLKVKTYLAELSADGQTRLWELIQIKLFQLVHSQNIAEQYGGVAAIDSLLGIESDEAMDSRGKLFRLFNYIKHLLPSNDFNLMSEASKTLGRIAKAGGASFGERFMDLEVSAALELIQPQQPEFSRYAGVLILKELARNTDTYFYSHIGSVLERIPGPLRDPFLIVRESTAELLAACLEIVSTRDQQTHGPYLTSVLSDAQLGLKQAQPEIIHGSLLAYRELLLHSGMFMRETFFNTVEQILRFKSHRDSLVRTMVITLIPTLAAYDTQTFTEHFLRSAMAHLTTQLNKSSETYYAFVAIGHTAGAVGSDMKPFLENIMHQIKRGLQARGKKNAPQEEPIFQCVGMLAAAVGPNLTKLLHEQLDLMFGCGLSEPLVSALNSIGKNIPPLLKTIQDRLLDLLSHMLSNQPYVPLGAPPRTSPHTAAMQATRSDHSPQQLALALATLGSFDFSGHVLSEFVRSCGLPYLEDDHPEVRQAAALTCCRLFVKDPICYQSSSHAIEVISDVLDKLLTVGIADPDPAIRKTVLQNLHERFDKHLAQAENVRSLFIALNDEIFENRMIAVTLIGRLSKHNPAYVIPPLRKTFLQLLTELEYSTVTRNREECTKLLSFLISSTQVLIKPYALPMIRVLLEKADDPSPIVAAHIIMCLGELVCVSGEGAMHHVPDLMRIILLRLDDSNVARRNAALHTLGQVCSSTGYVITPLVDHPELLDLLYKILQKRSDKVTKREVVKVLGILGAIDPYRRKPHSVETVTSETAVAAVNQVALNRPLAAAPDDYSQTVVVDSLLVILKDSALHSYHHGVIEAIMSIFKTQGLKCVGFLPQIVPAFIAVSRTATSIRLKIFYLEQMAILVGIIKQHIRNYMPDIFAVIVELWEQPGLHLSLVSLIESIGRVMEAEYKPFLPLMLPLVLRAFDGEIDDKRMEVQAKILDAFQTFGTNIEEYLHLVIPIIVRSYERTDGSIYLRKRAIQTVEGLTKRVNFSDHASRIIHPLVRLLQNPDNELRMSAMDTLCALLLQLGSDFAIFVPTINKCLVRNRITHPKYESLISKLLNGASLPRETGVLELLLSDNSRAPEVSAPAEPPKMAVNQQHLKQAWDISQVSTREDWVEWIHKLGVEFMKESPSHALRACMQLVDRYEPLAKELLNAAFLSCWTELYDQYQEDLVHCLETAITSSTAPAEMVHRLLNLAEFMEREEKALPIEQRTIGEYATKYLAYPKALYYKEQEFFRSSSPAVIEALISINVKLNQHDAAWGTLAVAEEQYDVKKHEEWYERLNRWQDALVVYDKKMKTVPSPEVELGRIKCLHALGEWSQLAFSIDEAWGTVNHDLKRQIAPMAAAAAWSLEEWDDMDDYIASMKGDSLDKAFYRGILAVHHNQFPKAMQHIAKARDLLELEITSFVGEGYDRTYPTIVRAQMLSELEEIIVYKQHADQPDRQLAIRNTWAKRLQGCRHDVDVWQRILQVRTLVLHPEDDRTTWIRFTNLARKAGRMSLADKTLASLLERSQSIPHTRAPPSVIYAQLKFRWDEGDRAASLEHMGIFSSRLEKDLAYAESDRPSRAASIVERPAELRKLLSRTCFKQGEWQIALQGGWTDSSIHQILSAYKAATAHDPSWYKAWHTWSLANFEVVNFMETRSTHHGDEPPGEALAIHVVQAIKGFFYSITLRTDQALQATLRLLTLWFKYGAHDDVSNAMASGFMTLKVDTWLEVIPQIIARIQTPHANIRRTINDLLTDVGRYHPQALIYPLTVASQSTSASRQSAAFAIMEKMKKHSPAVVQQASLVSVELIRVAILWYELWHEGLEEASRLWYTDKNADGMIAVLAPLHNELDKGPTTARESAFIQAFGKELFDAREACRRFQIYKEYAELDKAWEIYYNVFKKVERALQNLTTLDLQYVSPGLLKAQNLDLAVPGTYQSGQPIVKILRFDSKLIVISSKQRPRRLLIRGDDGRDYQYLLKGHEDLRQDERVMQLFSLVNTVLSIDTECFKRRLHIQRYPVIPLAPSAGLIGWVQDVDTLHVLVKEYRDSRKILLNIEYRLMLQMAPDYENLTLLQKVEVFEYALENTRGPDLYQVLWWKSKDSEHWVERRSNYTKSLAVNSMVGHILGLGDRHPSNILLERSTGKVIHIDFGDCFEVAMHREKFPEKVPFRLTRMLTHAMEASGIEGSFRPTCENSMRVLRSNKESLMAVLEAFVYDPLINWRLMQTDTDSRRQQVDLPARSRAAELARVAAHPQGPTRKLKADENDIFGAGGAQEVRNERALAVYNRVQNKLTGRDFNPDRELTVEQQVDRLILQATSIENLCQCFSGWCAFW